MVKPKQAPKPALMPNNCGTRVMPVPGMGPEAASAGHHESVLVDANSPFMARRGLSRTVSGVGVNTQWDAGVPYSVAQANGWLLRDASGALLTNVGYSDYYVADVGSAAYQAEYARRVGDYLASVGVDGAYIDDVLGDISGLTGGRIGAGWRRSGVKHAAGRRGAIAECASIQPPVVDGPGDQAGVTSLGEASTCRGRRSWRTSARTSRIVAGAHRRMPMR